MEVDSHYRFIDKLFSMCLFPRTDLVEISLRNVFGLLMSHLFTLALIAL